MPNAPLWLIPYQCSIAPSSILFSIFHCYVLVIAITEESHQCRFTVSSPVMDQNARGSPGSTIAASEMDEHITAPSSPSRPDPRTSLQHVLGDSDSRQNTPSVSRNGNAGDMTEDDVETTKPGPKSGKNPSGKGRGKAGQTKASENTSIYSGNKVRHLKKEDGEPLWRKDIQYDFLKLIFDDDKQVFTNSYDPNMRKQTFSELYIDAMARSSKTSKILRDKLLSENEPAKNMAMVCLLVNLGRMNTTLNCKC
jgi:Ino eighty subunit 1